MRNNIQSVRGMKDYLINETYTLQKIEKILKKILNNYGYSEIRLPIIENTVLFKNAIGNITDIVEKEMFNFKSKKNHYLTLRPEGTAGCIRSGIEHGTIYNQEKRIWYIGPMFRYERPQKGRYRQFYQLGVEVFGLSGPNIDLELILIALRFWKMLNIEKYITLHINSIGSFQDRNLYQKELIKFLEKNKNILDQDCKRRLYTNTLRILDSKNLLIKELLKKAPKISDFINKKSRKHFLDLCFMLDNIGVKYYKNFNLVRGLDYYNNTVFEWIVTDKEGKKNTICGGGRYDCLVKKLGGFSTPGVGFAVGMDRLLILFNDIFNKNKLKKLNNTDLYVVITDKKVEMLSIKLIEELRNTFKELSIVIHHKNVKNKNFFPSAHKYSSKFLLFIEKNSFIKEKFLLINLNNNNNIILSKIELIKKLSIFITK